MANLRHKRQHITSLMKPFFVMCNNYCAQVHCTCSADHPIRSRSCADHTTMPRAKAPRPAPGMIIAATLFSFLVLTAAQEIGIPTELIDALPASSPAAAEAADAPPAAVSSQPSPACQTMLAQLQISSSLPVVMIQLQNLNQVAANAAELQLLAKGPHLPGLMTTCGGPEGSDVTNQPIRMRVRGSSSAEEYAKKSFSLDPVNQIEDLGTADTTNIALLGLPSSDDWVLHGPENDRTLGMRNWLGYNMARWMGRYASRTKYFELFLNTDPSIPLSSQHYRGVYMLQEKVSRGKDRVNVEKYDAAVDPSGGYILAYENDNIEVTDTLLVTRLTKLTFLKEYPGGNNESTVMWIQRWMNDFEAELLSKPVANLSSVLDLQAAIDYFIVTEVSKNPDGYRGSIKMSKDRGGPLVLGPIWDLNEAFGLCCGYPIEGYQAGGRSNGTSGGSAVSAAGWRFNICQDRGRCRIEPADGISQWYRRMWQDATFRTAAAARWKELRGNATAGLEGVLTDQRVAQEVATLKELLGTGPDSAGQRNFAKWNAALNIPGFGVPFADWPSMFEAETKMLLDWTLARLKWLDAAFDAESLPGAGPDAYLTVDHGVVEPQVAGPASEGPGGVNVGMPAAVAVAGK